MRGTRRKFPSYTVAFKLNEPLYRWLMQTTERRQEPVSTFIRRWLEQEARRDLEAQDGEKSLVSGPQV